MNVLKITSNNFEQEVLKCDKPVLIDFYADWCGPCKMMSPIIDEIAEEKTGIIVGKVNIDEAQDLAVKYNVMSIPTIIIFKDGNIYKEFVGVTSKENILNELN
ncbi:MAG: thioredoxin [Clostridia bacterium]|nr:thioredoxin [Clostridia bacterium]